MAIGTMGPWQEVVIVPLSTTVTEFVGDGTDDGKYLEIALPEAIDLTAYDYELELTAYGASAPSAQKISENNVTAPFAIMFREGALDTRSGLQIVTTVDAEVGAAYPALNSIQRQVCRLRTCAPTVSGKKRTYYRGSYGMIQGTRVSKTNESSSITAGVFPETIVNSLTVKVTEKTSGYTTQTYGLYFRYRKILEAPRTLSSITVTTTPTKTVYDQGEALDLTGVVCTAAYSDGSAADVTALCTTSPADGATLDIAGTQIVTVRYAEGGTTVTTAFDVRVGYSTALNYSFSNGILTFEELDDRCSNCGGTGEVTTHALCQSCGGSGVVDVPEPCQTCGGTGTVEGAPCDSCEGSGEVTSSQECAECGGTGEVGETELCGSCAGTGRAGACEYAGYLFDGDSATMELNERSSGE